jgi:hypothetical protein
MISSNPVVSDARAQTQTVARSLRPASLGRGGV